MKADGSVVCADCRFATNPWTRFRGLMLRRALEPDEGLYIRPTNSIHMFFMRFPIDAVFCDAELRVLKVARNLRPWRMAGARGGKIVFELAAGAAAGVEPGDQLLVSE
jgi:uncharacterized protein